MNYFIDNIQQMTDNNQHTEALIEVANVIGAKKYARLLDALKTIRDIEGHNPLTDYQYQLYNELMEVAKQRLPEKDYEALRNAL